MSAVEPLKAARAAGIRVEIDGDDLMLEAPVPPPPIVLDLLSRHKTHVIAIATPASADDRSRPLSSTLRKRDC